MSVRILVAGGDGQLGREFADLAIDGVAFIRVGRALLDITSADSVARAIDLHQPLAIINAAAYTAVDRAESERDAAFAINADGPAVLAAAAERAGIPLLHVSTDYVFSGERSPQESWVETDACAPRSVYGASKLAGEERVLAACSRAFILRTSWVFGRYGNNFPKTMLRLAAERDELRVVGDQHGCPTHAGDIAATLALAAQALLAKRLSTGVYHYAGTPACTWHAFAAATIDMAHARGLLAKKPLIHAIATHEYPVAAPRPANSILDCHKLQAALGIACPDWHDGLNKLLDSLS